MFCNFQRRSLVFLFILFVVIISDAIINGIFSFSLFLIVHCYHIEIQLTFVLILYPVTLPKSYISCSRCVYVCVYVDSLGFFIYTNMSSVNKNNITSFPVWVAFYLFLIFLLNCPNIQYNVRYR